MYKPMDTKTRCQCCTLDTLWVLCLIHSMWQEDEAVLPKQLDKASKLLEHGGIMWVTYHHFEWRPMNMLRGSKYSHVVACWYSHSDYKQPRRLTMLGHHKQPLQTQAYVKDIIYRNIENLIQQFLSYNSLFLFHGCTQQLQTLCSSIYLCSTFAH